MATAAAWAQCLWISTATVRFQSVARSAGSIPPDEVLEQLGAFGLGDWTCPSRRNLPLRQELIELIAPAGQVLLAMILEPIISAFEALPTRDDGSEIGVLPLRMTWGLLEF